MVENLPAMYETWVPFLGQEGPLEKGMARQLNDYCIGFIRIER